MAFGHDGGRDVIRTFSPPVGFADSPLSEGAKKAVARRAKNRPFAAHKSLANVRAARVKIGSFPRRARRNLRYTTRICYNNSLYRVKSAVTPAFLSFKPCPQTG